MSWVVKRKSTGEVVMETFSRKVVLALDASKYEAIPIRQYLAGLNKPAAIPLTDKPESA